MIIYIFFENGVKIVNRFLLFIIKLTLFKIMINMLRKYDDHDDRNVTFTIFTKFKNKKILKISF